VYVVYGSSLQRELHIAFDPVGFMASSEQRHGSSAPLWPPGMSTATASTM
jgi:hypothetical protein